MLPTAPESDFLVSLGDVKEVRRCVLPESDISNKTHESFHQLLDKYQGAFLSSSKDIGEFKNALFEEVAKQLGVERKIYSPVYRPQANGQIEGFHKFLKECISKHMVNSLEWDDILPLAATAYNWFPNEHSK